MTTLKHLPVLLLILGIRDLSAQYFQQTYDLGFDDAGYSVAVLPNGDMALAGATGDVLWVQSIDAQGTVLWSKTFSNTYAAVGIRNAPGGGYWVAFNGQNAGGWMKISATGDVLFSRRCESPVWFNRMLSLADGGYLLSGYEEITGLRDAVALKIDASGAVVWKNGWGYFGADAANGCREDAQGFIYCSGYSETPDGDRDGLLTQLSPSGAVLWSRRYGTSGSDVFTDVAAFSGDSNLLLSGHSGGFGGENRIWLTEVRNTGIPKWSRTYSIAGQNLGALDLLAIPGNQFVLAAGDPAYQVGSPAILFKIALDGNLLWEYEYKSSGERAILHEVQPLGSGFAAFGSASFNGDAHQYIVTVSGSGLIPGADCCPMQAGLTVSDVSPETEPFTAGTNSNFNSTSLQVQASEVAPVQTDICTSIDLSFSLSDSSICPGECVDIVLSGNTPGVGYKLLTPGGVPDATNPLRICYPAAGFYFITREGSNGVCTKEQAIRVEVGNRPDDFPNAFTPNGDGLNDVFRPIFRCPVLAAHLRIYNRWGQMVFETRDPDAGWDGKTDGEEAASDVYAWQLEYEVLRDGVVEKRMEKGDVALLR